MIRDSHQNNNERLATFGFAGLKVRPLLFLREIYKWYYEETVGSVDGGRRFESYTVSFCVLYFTLNLQ